jgi:hypothetical protein
LIAECWVKIDEWFSINPSLPPFRDNPFFNHFHLRIAQAIAARGHWFAISVSGSDREHKGGGGGIAFLVWREKRPPRGAIAQIKIGLNFVALLGIMTFIAAVFAENGLGNFGKTC